MGLIETHPSTSVTASRQSRVDADLLAWLRVPSPAAACGELDRVQIALRGNGETTYVVVRDAAGRPLALLPVYTAAPPWPPTADLIDDLADTLGDQPRLCAAGSHGVPMNHLTVAKSADPITAAEAMAAAVREARQIAAEHGCRRLLFPYLDQDQVARLRAAEPSAVAGPVREKAVLPIVWASFEEYVASLPTRRRTPVRRERRRFLDSGMEVVEQPLSAVAAAVAPLVAATESRHGNAADADQIEFHYRLVAEVLGDDFRALLGYRDGSLLACALLSAVGSRWLSRAWGCDSAIADGSDFCYFNLTFYEPIVRAMARGVTAIDYGLGGLEAKTQRGCRPEPLQSLLIAVSS